MVLVYLPQTTRLGRSHMGLHSGMDRAVRIYGIITMADWQRSSRKVENCQPSSAHYPLEPKRRFSVGLLLVASTSRFNMSFGRYMPDSPCRNDQLLATEASRRTDACSVGGMAIFVMDSRVRHYEDEPLDEHTIPH